MQLSVVNLAKVNNPAAKISCLGRPPCKQYPVSRPGNGFLMQVGTVIIINLFKRQDSRKGWDSCNTLHKSTV